VTELKGFNGAHVCLPRDRTGGRGSGGAWGSTAGIKKAVYLVYPLTIATSCLKNELPSPAPCDRLRPSSTPPSLLSRYISHDPSPVHRHHRGINYNDFGNRVSTSPCVRPPQLLKIDVVEPQKHSYPSMCSRRDRALDARTPSTCP